MSSMDRPLDPTRVADLYQQFAGPLFRLLVRDHPGIDPQMVADAVVEAVLAAADSPPPVTGVGLRRRATKRLVAFGRSEARRLEREKKYSTRVTHVRPAGPSPLDELAAIADREFARRCRNRIARTDDERAALDEWLHGCTQPAELAARLNRPVSETERLLARFRKRISRERVGRGVERR